jgi:fatty-acyl-CoA synthase
MITDVLTSTKVLPAERYDLPLTVTCRYKINYITGAPITMTTLLSHPERKRFSHPVRMWTAGAPPPPSVIERFCGELGVTVHTAYGLTETYGPVTTHIPEPEWEGC